MGEIVGKALFYINFLLIYLCFYRLNATPSAFSLSKQQKTPVFLRATVKKAPPRGEALVL
jgi:hypothetical protein